MTEQDPSPDRPATDSLTPAWAHSHNFGQTNPAAERGTWRVMWITAAMMVLEIGAGCLFNSMALLADGWHMSSHAVAIGLSAVAYAAARRHAQDSRYAFGTWKIEVLGGFASALFLLGVAVFMVLGSVERLFSPQPIRYAEAMAVGVLGLAVNLVCALILARAHDPRQAPPQEPPQVHVVRKPHQGHSHSHSHSHSHHHDLNLRAAYLHVVADAATSVLAIVALAGGWWLGWSWLDPVMGLVGAAMVAHWARGLLRETSSAPLDRDMHHPVVQDIREAVAPLLAPAGSALTDLHVWRVSGTRYACALTLVTPDPTLDAAQVRQRLFVHEEIAHATVEIHRLPSQRQQTQAA